VPVAVCGHPSAGEIRLLVNDAQKQVGDLDQLIWNVPDTIAFLSEYYLLKPGDLIFTGTPAGVGAVKKGDKMLGGVDGLGELAVTVD